MDNGRASIEVNLVKETVWLTQAQMCQLFDKNKRTIFEHVRNIFKEGELMEESVARNFRTTASLGREPDIAHIDRKYRIEYISMDQSGGYFRGNGSRKKQTTLFLSQ